MDGLWTALCEQPSTKSLFLHSKLQAVLVFLSFQVASGIGLSFYRTGTVVVVFGIYRDSSKSNFFCWCEIHKHHATLTIECCRSSPLRTFFNISASITLFGSCLNVFFVSFLPFRGLKSRKFDQNLQRM